MIDTIWKNRELDAKQIIQKLLERLEVHAPIPGYSDDITIMVAKRVK